MSSARLPEVPAGVFRHWFFLQNANCFIHIAGTGATFAWIVGAQATKKQRHGFALPGDEIED